MKLIKDLGLHPTGRVRSDTGKPEYKRIYEVECETCNGLQKMRMSDYKRRPEAECQSCAAKRKATKHGLCNTKLYDVYNGMKARCYAESSKDYKHYGARGIVMCKEWLDDVTNFSKWANENGYKNGLTIDRINNDKGYTPENCRWTTQKIQTRNTKVLRNTNTSGYRGVTKKGNRYCARITVDYKRIQLGYYSTALEAAIAYDTYVINNNLEHTTNNLV